MNSDRIRRWSDDDHYWGPFTFSKSNSYKSFAAVLSSGEEEYPGCSMRVSLWIYTMILALPDIIPAYREQVKFSYIPAGERRGQDWYWKIARREYGFSLNGDDFFQIFYGRQPHDGNSREEQRWSWFLPWTQWEHVRHSYYGLSGEHYWTEPQPKTKNRLGWQEFHEKYDERKAMEDSCPAVKFSFTDYDGEMLTATTRIEEMEWYRGTGWFKWLRYFMKPKVRRSLDINFSGETGRRKGSWKGGTIGCGIDMFPGELHESAFRRYCEGQDTRHSKPRDIKFIGEV